MDLNSITFVSCWLKIDRPPMWDYYRIGQQVLEADINLVLFITPEFIPLLEIPEHRKSRIILKEVTTLTYQTPEILEKYKYCPSLVNDRKKCTSLYMVLMWNKFIFTNQICVENPFNTPLIAWLDYGYARLINIDLEIIPDKPYDFNSAIQDIVPALNFPELFMDKVRCCNITTLVDHKSTDFFNVDRSYIAGGFLFSSIKHMSKFCDLFDLELHALLNNNKYVVDEQILGYMASKYPDMFSLYIGRYTDLFRNFFRIKCRYWLVEHMMDDYKTQNRFSDGQHVIKYIHQSIIFGSDIGHIRLMHFINEAYISYYHCDNKKCVDIVEWFLELYEHYPTFKEISDINASFIQFNLRFTVIGKTPTSDKNLDIYIPHHQQSKLLINMLSNKYWINIYTDDNYNFCNIVKRNPSYTKNNNKFKEPFAFETNGDSKEIKLLIAKYLDFS